MEPEELTFQEIKEITDGFAQELGRGSFGDVFKGLTKTGKDIAVKVLRNDLSIDHKQFHNEFNSLAMLQHQNIVQLLGYCYETERKLMKYNGREVIVEEPHRVLCLEYLHNGSLRKYLSDEVSGLDWNTRFKIIKGTCEGLKYIHEELERPMYHLDLKPDNILLDKDMEPKIADFGLSKIFGEELKRTTRSPLGTPGYQPPEYIDKCEVSNKFDIFSLGVIMMMIVSGPECHSKYEDMSNVKIIDLVKANWRNRLQATWSGSTLDSYCHQVETCTQIARNCMQQDSKKRPNVLEIIDELSKIEIAIGKVPQKECSKTVPWMTMHDQMKMRKQSRQMEDQHQPFNLMKSDRYNDLKLVDIHKKSLDVAEDFIIGREDEKKKIIDSLIETMTEKITILPIYGIGGIGKTTFARLIYNDANFRFYSQVWIHVSPIFNLNKIGNSIISQLQGKESQTNESKMISACLKKLLSGKNNLIVLDDLWEDNPFLLEDLKAMLNLGDNTNTIVLVTTRSEHVAEKICTNIKPYKIKCLTNDMSWEIIKQRSAFETRDDKKYLTGIGKEIALKCGGVALAAQSLGFTLKSMKSNEWMEVKDNNIWKESISDDASLQNHVLASLMLTYTYMDSCLKPCFTYCAMFPRGQNIHKDDLIQQWISLGFIKSTKIHTITQVCEKHVVQLLGLSFLQQAMSARSSNGYNEKATIFRMHDLVHDLAISLLGSQILDQSKQGDTGGSSCQYALLADCSKPLELCLTSQAWLMALRFLHCDSTELRGVAFAPARSLRVLDLSQCSIQKLPDSIGELKQLRYLNTPLVRCKRLPECMTGLSHLIYLNLKASTITALPESIGEMVGLMHLDLSCCLEIQELPISFRNLRNFVHLDLSGCYKISNVSESLGSLSRLEYLNISHCSITGDLATALGGLTELKHLNLALVKCSGSLCRGMQEVVVNLIKLRYLDIQGLAEHNGCPKGEYSIFLELISSLSNLEYLSLGLTSKLHSIPETFGNLSKLHTLDVSCSSNLRRLPGSLSGIHSLKYLHVLGCSMLDKSTLPHSTLPNFVVHAGDGECSSNLCRLEYENPITLEIRRLENVKSAEEAQRIKLVEKQSIEHLQLVWTRDVNRFVDDTEVLKQLVPPDTLRKFSIEGYNGISFPSWIMNIATYLPQLREVILWDMPTCKNLPPLGQLPNLVYLDIGGMNSISKIDVGFYGGTRAFPRLKWFIVRNMKCLEEWNTAYPSPSGEDGLNELVFPNLEELEIQGCTKLRFKSCPPPGGIMHIFDSDKVVLSSWGKGNGDRGHVQNTQTTTLHVERCQAPLHHWGLLRHLPFPEHLFIEDCSDLTCRSTDLLQCLPSLETLSVEDCKSISQLPGRLGDLTSLKQLTISRCQRIKALPKGLQRLTLLQRLEIHDCPNLVQWCKSEVNKMRLPQIKVIVLDREKFIMTSIQELDRDVEDQDSIRTIFEVRRLEEVKSAQEAQRVKLVEKQSIRYLQLGWTRGAKRFVDDTEVLKQLVPPASVEEFTLQGYESLSFPSWMMDSIAFYLHHLRSITLRDLPNCKKLPPLGELPNLQLLRIGPMDNISKIDQRLYGRRRAFPRLESFELRDMKCLEEWKTPCTSRSDEDGSNELVFPILDSLSIQGCPKLVFKSCIPILVGNRLTVHSSDGVISSPWECRGQVDVATTWLCVQHCDVPLYRWSLLRHLPWLKELWIVNCNNLTCSSTDLFRCLPSLETLQVKECKCIAALPDWLGDLTSLKKLNISNCEGIKALPESVQQLTCLQSLQINDCPELVQWCKSEENKIKLAHIRRIALDYEKLSVMKWRRQKLENARTRSGGQTSSNSLIKQATVVSKRKWV